MNPPDLKQRIRKALASRPTWSEDPTDLLRSCLDHIGELEKVIKSLQHTEDGKAELRMKLTALEKERDLWREGCERNANCLRDALRAQDNQRLEILALKVSCAAKDTALSCACEFLKLTPIFPLTDWLTERDMVLAYIETATASSPKE